MSSVTVSPEFQIVIPRAVRERMMIEPGDKLEIVVLDDHIVLVPVGHPRQMRGLLAGIDTTIEREPDRY